jgi:KUP system potassium uptake protein
VQLGFVPRTQIAYTSAAEIGQVYIPGINWTLMIASIGLVLGFGSSSALAAAFGLAVAITMLATTVLFYVMARERWQWHPWLTVSVAGGFLLIDLTYLGANLLKIPHGGWFPLVIGAIIFTLLTTWKRGREILAARILARVQPRGQFLAGVRANPPVRVAGTAIFLFSDPERTPLALTFNLKHNRILHDRVVLLSVRTLRVPYVAAAERAEVAALGDAFYQVQLTYGFMETVDIPAALAALPPEPLQLDPNTVTYYLGRETILATNLPGMALWRERLFAAMARNARSAATFFRLPPDQVVEMGTQIEI